MLTRQKIIRKTAILLIWLVIWQLVSMLVGNKVLFASPLETLKALGLLCVEADFAKILIFSSLKLSLGFVLGLLLGAVFGCLGAKKKWMNDFLRPLLSFMKSVPVAAFVVLLLVWWGSKWLSVAIVFVVVFPHIYMAFYEGLRQVDEQMLEVATQNRKNNRILCCTAQVFTRVNKGLREQVTMVYEPHTFLGCFTVVIKKKYKFDSEGVVMDSKFRGWYCFTHTEELRNAYDTYKVIHTLSKEGFKDMPPAQITNVYVDASARRK